MKVRILSIIGILIGVFTVSLAYSGKAWRVMSSPQPKVEVPNIMQNIASVPLHTLQSHLDNIDAQAMKSKPSIKPIPADKIIPIASPYGLRMHPIHMRPILHKGVDFPGHIGTPILASADGIVNKALKRASKSTFGKHIIIQHDETYESLYAHLSKVFVTNGQVVMKGDTIGLMGSTGSSTNPHLHYEVHTKKRVDNPSKYFTEDWEAR